MAYLVRLASVGELAFPDQRRSQRSTYATTGVLRLNETLRSDPLPCAPAGRTDADSLPG